MKPALPRYILVLLLLFFSTPAWSATTTQNGNWSDGATWGGSAPIAGEAVTIQHTVTLDITPPNIASLAINSGGVLQFDVTGTGRALTITGSITINGGSIVMAAPGSATTHTMTVGTTLGGGSISNIGGTINMVNGTNVCNVTLNSNITQTIGGTGSTIFNNLTVNNVGGQVTVQLGLPPYIQLNPTNIVGNITVGGTLDLQRGIMIFAPATGTFTHSINNFSIGSATSIITGTYAAPPVNFNTGIWVNGAGSATVTLTISGNLTSPNLSHANAGVAVGLASPNCTLGTTTFNVDGNFDVPARLYLVGNAYIFGGSAPTNLSLNIGGNLIVSNSGSRFNGRRLGTGATPILRMTGGTLGSPTTYNVDYVFFLGTGGETNADMIWQINGVTRVVNGSSLVCQQSRTLTVNGTLIVDDGGEVLATTTGAALGNAT
ncbi:MAG: hypothetical protein HGB11_08340, partial [Chlorobiales bacterium]|nr:hypothetical protein [Chlorobiales bacterium]